MAVTIRSYPKLTRAIQNKLNRSRSLRRKYGGRVRFFSKKKRLQFADDLGWDYNPPVRFGTNQRVTTTQESLQKPQTIHSKEERSIRELGAVRSVEPTARGFKFTAADPRAAQILLDLTRETINKRNKSIEKRQKDNFKKVLNSKTVMTEKGLEDVFKEQKRILGTGIVNWGKRKRQINIQRIIDRITSDPKKIFSPDIKRLLREQKRDLNSIPNQSDFFTRSTRILDNVESRLKKKKARVQTELKRINTLGSKEDINEARKTLLKGYLEDIKRITKNLPGFIALGLARFGLAGLQLGASVGKLGIAAEKVIINPVQSLKNVKRVLTTTNYKKLALNDLPQGFFRVMDSEAKSFTRNPISYAVEVFAFQKAFELVAGTVRATGKLIKKGVRGSRIIETTGFYFNRLGKRINYVGEFIISKEGKVNLNYVLKQAGKKTVTFTKSIQLKPSVKAAISKAIPTSFKTAAKTTQTLVSNISNTLTEVRLFRSIAKYNTKLRIKSVPINIRKRIQLRLNRIRFEIKNNKITQKTLNRLQFIKDDLRRYNIKVSYNLDKLKVKGLKLKGKVKDIVSKIKLPSIFKNTSQTNKKYILKIKLKLSELKLYRSISKFNTKLRIRTITRKKFSEVQRELRAIKLDLKTNKLTQKTLTKLQSIKDGLEKFNIKLSYDFTNYKKAIKISGKIIKGRVKGIIKKPFETLSSIGKEKLSKLNIKYINKIRQSLNNIKLYKSISKFNTNLRIKTITRKKFSEIQRELRAIKLDLKTNKITQKTLNRLQFIKDDLRRFNVKVSYNLNNIKKAIKGKVKVIKAKVIKTLKKISPFEFVDQKKTTSIINKEIKKLRKPRRKQVLKNLRRFGRPKLISSGKFKGKYLFENKLTGTLKGYTKFMGWYKATIRQGRFLLTTTGKRALRKAKQIKTRAGRIKSGKAEKLFAKEKALLKKGKQPKAVKTITRKQRKLIKKKQALRRRDKRKLLIQGGVNIRGIDRFFNAGIVGVIEKPSKEVQKINQFLKKASEPKKVSKKSKPKITTTKASEGQVLITETKTITKVKVKVKQKLKDIIQVKQDFKGLQSKLEKLNQRFKIQPILRIKTQIRLVEKQKNRLRSKVKQKQKQILKLAQKVSPKLAEKVKSILKPITITRTKVRQKVKTKTKTKTKTKLKQRLKTKTIKKPLKPKGKKPVKKFEDERKKKIIKRYLEAAKKSNKGILLSDLAANLLDQKATKKQRLRLLDPKTVFTGFERRLIV